MCCSNCLENHMSHVDDVISRGQLTQHQCLMETFETRSNLSVYFHSCVQSTTSLDLSNSRCLMPNVSKTCMCVCVCDYHCLCINTHWPWCIMTLCVCVSASSKTVSGLLEFDSRMEAVEVLTVLNHHQIRIPSQCDSCDSWHHVHWLTVLFTKQWCHRLVK